MTIIVNRFGTFSTKLCSVAYSFLYWSCAYTVCLSVYGVLNDRVQVSTDDSVLHRSALMTVCYTGKH